MLPPMLRTLGSGRRLLFKKSRNSSMEKEPTNFTWKNGKIKKFNMVVGSFE